MSNLVESKVEENGKIGEWLDAYRNHEEIKNNVFETEEEIRLDVTVPKKYDEQLPKFECPEGHTVQTVKDII